jgi:hypothetical protein
MGVLRSVGAAGVVATLWVLGCSDDDPSRKAPRTNTDAAGGTSGRGGSAGIGGSSTLGTGGTGGTGATNGASGTGATNGASGSGATNGASGTGTDAGDASIDVSIDAPVDAPQDTFDAGLECPPIPVPDAGDAGDADTADAFTTEGGLLKRWRDWSANACRSCPAVAVECPDVATTASFDPATEILRLELAAGIAELVSGTISFHWDAVLDDGGFDSGTATVPFVVDENAIVADLSSQLLPGVNFLYTIDVQLTDACGIVSEFRELQVRKNQPDPDASPDAGDTWRVRCLFGEN